MTSAARGGAPHARIRRQTPCCRGGGRGRGRVAGPLRRRPEPAGADTGKVSAKTALSVAEGRICGRGHSGASDRAFRLRHGAVGSEKMSAKSWMRTVSVVPGAAISWGGSRGRASNTAFAMCPPGCARRGELRAGRDPRSRWASRARTYPPAREPVGVTRSKRSRETGSGGVGSSNLRRGPDPVVPIGSTYSLDRIRCRPPWREREGRGVWRALGPYEPRRSRRDQRVLPGWSHRTPPRAGSREPLDLPGGTEIGARR
jgi:hypothetical protein